MSDYFSFLLIIIGINGLISPRMGSLSFVLYGVGHLIAPGEFPL